jgi:transcriptional regulator with XRE-family HTH domain
MDEVPKAGGGQVDEAEGRHINAALIVARLRDQFAQEVRRRRMALGWTLNQLAEACGVSANYLGSLESGQRDPHLSTIDAIARALGCSAADLVPPPDSEMSPGALELGRLFDLASPQAQEAVVRMMQVLGKPGGRKGKGPGKRPRRPREEEEDGKTSA